MTKSFTRQLALSAALLGMMAGSAMAADSYVDQGHDWTGFYLGAHAGYGFSNYNGIFDSAGTEYDFSRNDDDDVLAGVQLGYNYQLDSMVIGLEGDLTLFDTSSRVLDDPGGEDNIQKVDFNGLASVRGRLGFATDSLLFYGTGGLGFADFDTHTEFDENNPGDKQEFTSVGFVLGAGAEMMVTENVSVRLEYLHYFFDDEKNLDGVNDADIGDFFKLDDVGTIRLGVNWFF